EWDFIELRPIIFFKLCQLYTEVFPLGMEVFRCSPIRGFLLDITGVLYNSSPNTLGVAIPGSIDAVNRPEWEKHLIKPNLIANNLKEAVDILLQCQR
uniref:Phospholysine phosphohistidine inorganic pyrophosphate phosphatase n=1 Tax=Parascaris univalens TaxID=6257 RepID=A0A915A735_PARUN